MIELTNLMKGDYVLCNGKVCRVKEIGGMACVAPVDEEEELFCNAENIEPIPLTDEILEKNGFRYNETPFAQSFEQFGLSIYGGYRHFHINCGFNVWMDVRNCHQLQHALKLCGIEKEITL